MPERSEAERIDAERPALRGLAYRMTGSMVDAEDAVQEAYVRWLRLDDADRAEVRNPGAWLMRATARICLDMLGSARARRETYIGPWLPEPVPAGDGGGAGDPLDRVARDDTVSMAMQVVLDTLTPAERVAFVLHDVFELPFGEIADIVGRTSAATRQLAASARRKVRARREVAVTRQRHDDAARAFAAASERGDLAALVAVLDPDVVLVSDGGGLVSAARRPVRGADNVARFLLGILDRRTGATVTPIATADGLGFLTSESGTVDTVAVLGVTEAGISDVWLVRNPDKLRGWG